MGLAMLAGRRPVRPAPSPHMFRGEGHAKQTYCAAPAFGTSASVVMSSLISSLTFGTYAPRPKSERLSVPVALKPIAGWPVIGCAPLLLSVAFSTTDLVTPFTVRSPVTL